MASESVTDGNDARFAALMAAERQDRAWRPNFNHESDGDVLDRKLHQAEMLLHTISGSDDFEGLHQNIRSGVLWLAADLLTEVREAHERVRQATRESKGAASNGH